VLGGTALDSELRERHGSGLHVAGSSTGASAMSAVMIAGGKARSAARLSAVRMSPGLGILRGLIVDQHFRERDRFGRLLAAVLCNPSMLGFGLDEDTAFELDPNDRVSIVGSGTLTIIDGAELATNLDVVPEAPAVFAGMRMHVLAEGWSYDLATRRVECPPAGSRKAVGQRGSSAFASANSPISAPCTRRAVSGPAETISP
jgi:cyanophycinase